MIIKFAAAFSVSEKSVNIVYDVGSTVILAIISGGGFGGKDTRSSVYSIPVAIAAKKYEFDNYISYTMVAAIFKPL